VGNIVISLLQFSAVCETGSPLIVPDNFSVFISSEVSSFLDGSYVV